MDNFNPQDEMCFSKEIKYLLYKPKDYSNETPSSLLIFLHGAGEKGDDLELVKIHGPPKLLEGGVDLPFIVALNEWWSPSTRARAAYGNTEFTVYPEAEHDSWTETYENKRLNLSLIHI